MADSAEELKEIVEERAKVISLREEITSDIVYTDVRERLVRNAQLWLGLAAGVFGLFAYFTGTAIIDGMVQARLAGPQAEVEVARASVETTKQELNSQFEGIKEDLARLAELEQRIDILDNRAEVLAFLTREEFNELLSDRVDKLIYDIEARVTLCFEGPDITRETVEQIHDSLRFGLFFDGEYRTGENSFTDYFLLDRTPYGTTVTSRSRTYGDLHCGVQTEVFFDRTNDLSPVNLAIDGLPRFAGFIVNQSFYDPNDADDGEYEKTQRAIWSRLVAGCVRLEVNRLNLFFALAPDSLAANEVACSDRSLPMTYSGEPRVTPADDGFLNLFYEVRLDQPLRLPAIAALQRSRN